MERCGSLNLGAKGTISKVDARYSEKPRFKGCFFEIMLEVVLEQAFFWTLAKKLKVKKLKLKLKKLKTQEFFAKNSKLRQFFHIFNKIFNQT